MNKIKNLYDLGYKFLLSNRNIMTKFLKYFIHEKIINDFDFSTLKLEKTSFIDETLKEKESDIIYKVKYKNQDVYIYILLEHQSSVDKEMPLRFMEYIIRIYRQLYRNKKVRDKYPNVFPILLYNGEAKWSVSTKLEELINKNIPTKYIPKLSYYKLAINEIPKKYLLKISNIVSAIFYLEKTSAEEIEKKINVFLNMLEKENKKEVEMVKYWSYKYLTQTTENPEKIIEKVKKYKEVKTMLQTSLLKRDEKIRIKSILTTEEKFVKNLIIEEGITDIQRLYKLSGLAKNKIKKILETIKPN